MQYKGIDRCELVYENDERRAQVLILEDEHAEFGKRLTDGLGPEFRVLSFTEPHCLMGMLGALHARRLPIHAIIIYKSISIVSFLQFLSFFNDLPHARQATTYYYDRHVLYAFQGGRRILAQPFFLIDDVDLQTSTILETLSASQRATA